MKAAPTKTKTEPARLTPRERFLGFVFVEPYSGCWLWGGYVCRAGYGRWWRGRGRSALAHRGGFELFRGPILGDLELHHLCRVRLCVNPWHQEAITPAHHRFLRWQEAQAALAALGQRPPVMWRRPGRCARGHPLSGDNVRLRGITRWEQCLTCLRLRRAKRSRLAKRKKPRAAGDVPVRPLTKSVLCLVLSSPGMSLTPPSDPA